MLTRFYSTALALNKAKHRQGLMAFLLVAVIPMPWVLADEPPRDEVQMLPQYSMKLALKTTASKATVWALWEDVANWKRFDTLLEYSQLDPDQTFIHGATGVIKAKGSPKTRFEIIALEHGSSFTEQLKLPLYQSIDLQRYFEATQDGSTVFVHEVNFKGRLRWITHALAASAFKKELPLVMTRLKALAEQQDQLSPPKPSN